MRKIIHTLFVLAFITSTSESKIWAQTYTMKKTVADEQLKKDVLALGKELFKPSATIEYTISTCDLMGSFDDMSKSMNYDLSYKELQERYLDNDPTNSVLWNNLGNYYNGIGDKETAKKKFQKSYDFLDLTFSKDSAFFHSFRGLLKANLGMDGVLEDFERAAQINPNDSIAMLFLPLMLLNAGEYDKAKTYCNKAIGETEGNNQGTWYIFFAMANLMEQFGALQREEKGAEKLSNDEYDKVFDMTSINAVYERYKTNQAIANAKLMSDILALYCKLITFDMKDGQLKLKYTKKETQKIEALRIELISMKDQSMMNEFSRIKNLAFVSFLQGKTEVAKDYFEQAIVLFPKEKSNDQFTSMNCYEALFCIYELEKNGAQEKTLLERMIAEDEQKGPNVKHLCDMAKCYIQEDNYDEVYNWAYKAFQASETNCETFRVLAQYSFYIGDGQNLDAYVQAAAAQASSGDETYNLSLQIALYYLTIGKADEVHRFTQQARDVYPGVPCELCDKLEKNYIKETR